MPTVLFRSCEGCICLSLTALHTFGSNVYNDAECCAPCKVLIFCFWPCSLIFMVYLGTLGFAFDVVVRAFWWVFGIAVWECRPFRFEYSPNHLHRHHDIVSCKHFCAVLCCTYTHGGDIETRDCCPDVNHVEAYGGHADVEAPAEAPADMAMDGGGGVAVLQTPEQTTGTTAAQRCQQDGCELARLDGCLYQLCLVHCHEFGAICQAHGHTGKPATPTPPELSTIEPELSDSYERAPTLPPEEAQPSLPPPSYKSEEGGSLGGDEEAPPSYDQMMNGGSV